MLHLNSCSTICHQAAPSPGRTDCTLRGEDLDPVEGGSSNAVVGGVCESGAAACWYHGPYGWGLPKQVRNQWNAPLPVSLILLIIESLCFRRKQRYQSAPRNIHRHVLLSEIKEAISTLPLVRNKQLNINNLHTDLVVYSWLFLSFLIQ